MSVFATHDIRKGAHLRLFGDEGGTTESSIERPVKDIPQLFQQYCLDWGDILRCPQDFGHLEIGWYLNHSKTPNAQHRAYNYYALRNIKAGEEILIDYNTLEEPVGAREDYYKT